MAGLRLDRTSIISAGLAAVAKASPPACRIVAEAHPVPGSRVGFELWLPMADWNGRYYQIGTGGFGGMIFPDALAAEAARGNAAAMTDSGHRDDRMSAAWALDNSIAVADYGYRSIKVTSDAARALIRAFYGRPAAHRYFAGCSNGGRQALMAAARYPSDWSGIIAGSAANPWTEQFYRLATLQHHLRTVPGAWIPADKLPAVERAALATCPARAVQHGNAADPRLCHFDPERLLCRDGDGPNCLTGPQVASVRLIQRLGYDATAAAGPDSWSSWIVPTQTGASQLEFAEQAFRYLLRNDPAWRIAAFDPRRDKAAAVRAAAILDAPADLRHFHARGGKIIAYFGWADSLIAPGLALDSYRASARANGGRKATTAFYRLFMVPGMGHCQGGTSAYAFGQSADAPASRADRTHDIRGAIEAWVERGQAPDTLVVTNGKSSRVLRPL
ncbi:MAG: tannase/feruloyl esterase family alpha/beta hydrolase [Sphingomicrobium sp.]